MSKRSSYTKFNSDVIDDKMVRLSLQLPRVPHGDTFRDHSSKYVFELFNHSTIGNSLTCLVEIQICHFIRVLTIRLKRFTVSVLFNSAHSLRWLFFFYSAHSQYRLFFTVYIHKFIKFYFRSTCEAITAPKWVSTALEP